jgi:hypothetical protein
MRFPTLKPNPDNFRVDLIEDDFRNRVWEKGTLVSWSQACDCPCGTVSDVAGRSSAVRDFPVNCPMCSGRGKIYTDPQDITVLMTASSSSEEVYNVWGEYSSGTSFFSFLPENLPLEWDKITLKEGSRLFTESRIRKSLGLSDSLRYAIVKRKIVSGSEEDAYVPYEQELGTTLCYKGVSLGVTDTTPLVENVDFSVTEDGLIDWSLGDDLGTSPLPGERYAIRYFCRPTFVVRDFPYIKRDFYELVRGGLVYQNYPIKVLAVMEHLSTFTSPHSPPDTGP